MSAWPDADACVPPAVKLEEDAYLISRGVRPAAIVGHCADDPAVTLRVRTRLSAAAQRFDALVFIVPDGHPGSAVFGYASHAWVVTMLEWACSDAVPAERSHELLGLLLGYSPAAIARHQERDHAWPRCGEIPS